MPKVMKKKISKTSPFTVDILQLKTGIALDYDKLYKLYPKSLANIEKAIKAVTKELKKAKLVKKTAKEPVGKGRKPKVNPVDELAQELTRLKTEQAILKFDQKKFKNQQKVLAAFEKLWAKKAKQAARKPKKARKAKPPIVMLESKADEEFSA